MVHLSSVPLAAPRVNFQRNVIREGAFSSTVMASNNSFEKKKENFHLLSVGRIFPHFVAFQFPTPLRQRSPILIMTMTHPLDDDDDYEQTDVYLPFAANPFRIAHFYFFWSNDFTIFSVNCCSLNNYLLLIVRVVKTTWPSSSNINRSSIPS